MASTSDRSHGVSVDPDCSRRAALGGLLRARREQLTPADLGLEGGSRRRTPGLRREEVATEAGVSITYLTYLEQGREVTPSVQVLDALARALRMSDVERQHLFELAHGTAPPYEAPTQTPVHPVTLDTLEALDPVPAYVADWRGDVLALNHGAMVLFGEEWAELTGLRRNGTYWLLTSPRAAALFMLDDAARRTIIARFRPRADRYRGHPAMDELRDALGADVPGFADWWALHEVESTQPFHTRLDHPLLGEVELGHLVMTLGHGDDQRMIVHPAASGSEAARRLEALAADRGSRVTTRPASALPDVPLAASA